VTVTVPHRTPSGLRALAGVVLALSMALSMALAAPAPLAAEEAFRVGQGDKLAIGVHRRPDLSGEFRVQPDGNLPLPFLGPVPAAGLTLDAVRLAIVQRLRDDAALLDPRIAVELVEGRPIAVGGTVRRAGSYPFQIGMTVAHAVAAAGGVRASELDEIAGQVEAGRLRERLRQSRDAIGAGIVLEARLLAERDNADSFEAPEAARAYLTEARWRNIVPGEQLLLKQRQEVIRNQVAALSSQIAAYRDEAAALASQGNAKAREAELLEQEARYIESLQRQGLSARNTRAIELARLSVQIEGERFQIASYSARARQEISRAENTLTGTINLRKVEITQALLGTLDNRENLAVGLEEIAAVLTRLGEAIPDVGSSSGAPGFVIVRSDGTQAVRLAAQPGTVLRPGDLVEVSLPTTHRRISTRSPSP